MELNDTFTSLCQRYSAVWLLTNHLGPTRRGFMKTFTRPHWQGVYVIYSGNQSEPLYVGSAGKLERGPLGPINSNQTVRQRLFYSSTPYHFDRINPIWHYGPTNQNVSPAGYHYNVPLPNIRIESFHIPNTHAASSLEHILLQGCVNEFGNLPVANQEF